MLVDTIDDADLYDHDIALFADGKWLNSSCINYCYRKIDSERRVRHVHRDSVLLLDPSVCSLLRMINVDSNEDIVDEMNEIANGIKLDTRKWIFAPINNSNSFTTNSDCSHWSLLLVHVDTCTFFAFDSMSQTNKKAAVEAANAFAIMLKKSVSAIYYVGNTPQQHNSFDCGIYTLLYSEYLSDVLLDDGISVDDVVTSNCYSVLSQSLLTITPAAVASYRRSMHNNVR